MKLGSLFSGYGGLELGIEQVLPAETAWHVEYDAAPSRILAHHWPTVPNYGDITTVNWAAVEPVDILTGGFPCQDVSIAGLRRGLHPDTRSGLWSHFALAIDALRPSLVIVENVRGLLSAEAHSDLEPDAWDLGDRRARPPLRALGAVLGDLADLGYDAEWCSVRAADAGAPHGRFRVFLAAHPAGSGLDRWDLPTRPAAEHGQPRNEGRPTAAHPGSDEPQRRRGPRPVDGPPAEAPRPRHPQHDAPGEGRSEARDWGPYRTAIDHWQRIVGRVAPAPTQLGARGQHRLEPAFVEWMMGLPAGHVADPAIGLTRNEQLKALGNGVVPQQAALALARLLNRTPALEGAPA